MLTRTFAYLKSSKKFKIIFEGQLFIASSSGKKKFIYFDLAFIQKIKLIKSYLKQIFS